jgi:hypothetical protein
VKRIKIDGTNRLYIMDNGDKVPFDEYADYKAKKLAPKKPVKKRTRKKKETTIIETEE